MRAPLFSALVHGPSMAPTLRHGDAILVRRGTRARPGRVAVVTFATRPGLLFVKRLCRREDDGWWAVGDNTFVTDDSRAYGVAQVVGTVLLRWWPRPGGIR
jgi:nickel-type superoxide dismutase maturation protease